MVVALGALHPDSQESLAYILCKLLRLQRCTEIVCRTIQECISRGGQYLLRHCAPGLIRSNGVMDVIVKRPHALIFERPTVHPEQVAPFVGPEINILRPGHERVDEAFSLPWISVPCKFPHRVRNGQSTCKIDVGPSNECEVIRYRRDRDMQLRELRRDESVDVTAVEARTLGC